MTDLDKSTSESPLVGTPRQILAARDVIFQPQRVGG